MSTIAIPLTEYRTILKTQDELKRKVLSVEKMVRSILEEDEEVKESVLRRWEKISRETEKGKGKKLGSMHELEEYLNNL